MAKHKTHEFLVTLSFIVNAETPEEAAKLFMGELYQPPIVEVLEIETGNIGHIDTADYCEIDLTHND
jgi:hypothetical protein